MPDGIPHSGKLRNDPMAQKLAVSMLANGLTQVEVGQKIGVHQSAVSTWSRQPEIRKRLEDETIRLLNKIPDAVTYAGETLDQARQAKVLPHLVEYEVDDPESETGKRLVKVPADPKTIANNIKLKAVGWDVAKAILGVGGIIAQHTESRTVTNLLLVGDSDSLNPVIKGLVGHLMPAEIDITPESGESLFIPDSDT